MVLPKLIQLTYRAEEAHFVSDAIDDRFSLFPINFLHSDNDIGFGLIKFVVFSEGSDNHSSIFVGVASYRSLKHHAETFDSEKVLFSVFVRTRSEVAKTPVIITPKPGFL